jgi:glycosyltransferase involved in cell wall biosynthesis
MVGPPILYLPSFDFHLLPQRPQQLLWALADEGFEIIYCNVTQNTDRAPFEELKPGFTLCHNIKTLDREAEYIMWWTHSPYMEILPDFHLKMIVSDIADATVEEFQYYQPWQRSKIELGDLVLCASAPIFAETRALNPHSLLVRNGVDHRFFRKVFSGEALPGEEEVRKRLSEKSLPGTDQIIGFWGAVATWLDYELLEWVVENRPEYTLVLIGPANTPKAAALAAKHPNVILNGYRPYNELPAWARRFRAGLIPFEVRGVTQAANPIKMYEYLAAGLPVIATDLPEARECSLVQVAADRSSFLDLVDQAVTTKSDPGVLEERLKFAAANSWSSRAYAVAAAIRELLPQTTPHLRGSWSPKPIPGLSHF